MLTHPVHTATTVPALLDARAETEPDRTALIVAPAKASAGEPDAEPDGLTFGRWRDRADAVGHGLLARGVRPGDRIGLRFDGSDWRDFAIAYAAVTSVGAVAVPLPERAPPARIRDLLDQCAASGPDPGPGGGIRPRDGWAAGRRRTRPRPGGRRRRFRSSPPTSPRSSTPPAPPAGPRESAPATPT